jgi:hypothetical protein
MMEAADIARWIHDLASSDAKQKAESGMRLYLAGVNLCMPLLSQWVGDPEFRGLTLPEKTDASGNATAHHGPSTIVIGIAVHPETFERIHAANNSPRLANVPPDQDAREFELHLEDSIELDILTTRAPGGSGAIARFLEKFGEEIQQVEIYVRDVDRATGILRTGFGLTPIYPATRAGADGTRVNFFLATRPDGKKVLIEFVEAAG